MSCTCQRLRLGTRASLLARMQSQIVANALEVLHPALSVELVICKTTGDSVTDRPLAEVGGKGLFTKELEEALLRDQIDFAVHSFKDVPVTMPLVNQSQLTIAAVPRREDARDVLVSNGALRLNELARGARVGTGSPRRRAQLLSLRPDLRIENVRGNVDTRLKKVASGEFDAVVLAAAGLHRSGLYDKRWMVMLDPDDIVPSAGQGALALQCRREDARTRTLLAVLDDAATACCVSIERAIVSGLNGDCHSPIGAYATLNDGQIRLKTAVAAAGGEPPVTRCERVGGVREIASIVAESLAALKEQPTRYKEPEHAATV